MRAVLTIFLKELKDILRDRKTIIAMIVIPLFLFPVLMGITVKIQKDLSMKAQEKQLRVAVISKNPIIKFTEILNRQKDISIIPDIAEDSINTFIQDERLDGAYVFSDTFEKDIENLQPGSITFYFKSSDEQNITRQRLREPLNAFEKAELSSRFQKLNLEESMINPVSIKEIDVATPKQRIGRVIGGFLPYIFVLFCFIGCMIPAIDLGAGEKERGTLETLLTAPVSRIEILGGKFMVVSLAGLMSALVAFLGLYFTFKYAVHKIGEIPPEIKGVLLDILEPKSIFLLISMLLPLTMFFAGIMLSLSMYAKTFKESQSIIGPLNIVVILPIFIGLMPGIELNAVTAFIPVLNVSLASKEIFAGAINLALLMEVYASLILLAGCSIFLAARFFTMESVIFRT